MAELFPLVGVVCLFPGGGVVLVPCTTGDFFVLDFDPCLAGDTLGEVFDFFLSTMRSIASSSSPKYLTPPLVPLLVVGCEGFSFAFPLTLAVALDSGDFPR